MSAEIGPRGPLPYREPSDRCGPTWRVRAVLPSFSAVSSGSRIGSDARACGSPTRARGRSRCRTVGSGPSRPVRAPGCEHLMHSQVKRDLLGPLVVQRERHHHGDRLLGQFRGDLSNRQRPAVTERTVQSSSSPSIFLQHRVHAASPRDAALSRRADLVVTLTS